MTDTQTTYGESWGDPAAAAGFYARLAAAQLEYQVAAKDQANRYDGYTYASYAALVDAVRRPLSERGIAIVQLAVDPPDDARGPAVSIRTILAADDYQLDTGVVTIPVRGRRMRGGEQGEIDAQAYGAAYTYARRYGLELATGLAREDSDSIDQQPSAPVQRAPTLAHTPMPSASADLSHAGWGQLCSDLSVGVGDIARWLDIERRETQRETLDEIASALRVMEITTWPAIRGWATQRAADEYAIASSTPG